MELRIKKLHPAATTPSFAHDDDAGMDIFAAEEVTIEPGARVQVRTGIAMAIPVGYVGLIWDKSGISHKRGIKVLGGVVDAGYRGEILIGLINLSSEPQTFAVGDKLAQILIQEIERPEVTLVDELDETARGSGAFGSTGV